MHWLGEFREFVIFIFCLNLHCIIRLNSGVSSIFQNLKKSSFCLRMTFLKSCWPPVQVSNWQLSFKSIVFSLQVFFWESSRLVIYSQLCFSSYLADWWFCFVLRHSDGGAKELILRQLLNNRLGPFWLEILIALIHGYFDRIFYRTFLILMRELTVIKAV